MVSKIRVVLNSMIYPVFLGRYFWEALLQRDDVELKVVGPFTDNWIPWNNGMLLPKSYVRMPDIALTKNWLNQINTPSNIIVNMLGDFAPDLWINIDAGYNVTRPNLDCQVVNVFTDGHVLEQRYAQVRDRADINYNMHHAFAKPGDRILPYAASQVFHYPEEAEYEYDVCLIGLHYPQRDQLVQRLQARGLKVYYDLGPAYDDYRKLYAKSKVAISWSSKGDLIARVFETLAMKKPLVTDRVQDLPNHFVENEHYKGFDDRAEAEFQVLWCLNNFDEAQEMAANGYRKVYAQDLYAYRVSNILRDCKLI